MRIAVLYGGCSTEKDASELSASSVAASLTRLGHEPALLFYDRDAVEQLKRLAPDAVFLCVQGKGHGDGTAQALLDFLGIPYTGSGVEAAAIINDKIMGKRLARLLGVSAPADFCLARSDYDAPDGLSRFRAQMAAAGMGYPVVAKAPSQGGSFGLALLESDADFDRMGGVFGYDDPILIEAYIEGDSQTVGLIERDGELLVFPVIEGKHVTKIGKEFVKQIRDYKAEKAQGPDEALEQMRRDAETIFRFVGARGYARVDFMLSTTGRPYFLEINAVPGLKQQGSLYPPGARAVGLEYDDIIACILKNAFKR